VLGTRVVLEVVEGVVDVEEDVVVVEIEVDLLNQFYFVWQTTTLTKSVSRL
jgi:hypothetical protein